MSPGGRSERIRILRETIARMEGGCAPGLAASEGSRSSPEAETRALERRRLAFFEVAPAHASDAPAAAGFALAVAGRFLREEGGALLWIADEFALLEGGAPYAPGLGAFGLGWRDLVLMRLPRRADVFLALEEAIRSRAFGAVICEPGALSGADAPAIVRRLAMGARTGGARAILLRPPASARAVSCAHAHALRGGRAAGAASLRRAQAAAGAGRLARAPRGSAGQPAGVGAGRAP